MTERESPLQTDSFASNLITVSWQLGDDVRLIRRTIASKEEEIGRVLERVLMEAFVLGHLREVDAFLDPRVVRNRWQAFVRRNGHDDPLRMNQTFTDAQIQQNDRLLLRPLPQPLLPAESLTEDLLQQPRKTSGLLWVTLLAVGLAVGTALWFLRSTLWPLSPVQTAGKQRPHPPLPAIPTPEPHKANPPETEPPTTSEPSTSTEPPATSEPSTLTEPPENTEPPLSAEPSSEPVAADAGSDEEDPEDPPPARRIVPLRIKRPLRKGQTKKLLRKGQTKKPSRKRVKPQTGLRPSPPAVRLRRSPSKRKRPVKPRPAPPTEP